MPAYRSEAEADVRSAVVARIRQSRPEARIIHEINIGSYGATRMDLIAVSEAEIIAAEIKSKKDKLDRLPKQIKGMRGCAHHVIAALHEKFLVEKATNKWAAQYERDGVFYLRDLPDDIERYSATFWVYPETDAGSRHSRWEMPRASLQAALPSGALNLLWRDELAALCAALSIPAGRRATMTDMTRALRWQCSGSELTLGICAALRARSCVEADPAIEDAA